MRVPTMRGRQDARAVVRPSIYGPVQVLTVIVVGAGKGTLKEDVGSAGNTCFFFF